MFKKIFYLSTNLIPTQRPRKPEREQFLCFFRLLSQSIAISLSRFFNFASISLEVTFIHSFIHLSSLFILELSRNLEGDKFRATIRRLPRPNFANPKILLFDQNFLFSFVSLYLDNIVDIQHFRIASFFPEEKRK